jgi:hypothetical protein
VSDFTVQDADVLDDLSYVLKAPAGLESPVSLLAMHPFVGEIHY